MDGPMRGLELRVSTNRGSSFREPNRRPFLLGMSFLPESPGLVSEAEGEGGVGVKRKEGAWPG